MSGLSDFNDLSKVKGKAAAEREEFEEAAELRDQMRNLELVTQTQVVEDTPLQARTMAEPGDLYAVEHIVHMISQKPCIALQIYLVTAQRQPRDPNPLRPYDRQALFALLSQITATLKPLK